MTNDFPVTWIGPAEPPDEKPVDVPGRGAELGREDAVAAQVDLAAVRHRDAVADAVAAVRLDLVDGERSRRGDRDARLPTSPGAGGRAGAEPPFDPELAGGDTGARDAIVAGA